MDLAVADRSLGHRTVDRWCLQPAPLCAAKRREVIRRAPRADKRVSALEVQAEPRRFQPAVHYVEPEANLGQFDCGRV